MDVFRYSGAEEKKEKKINNNKEQVSLIALRLEMNGVMPLIVIINSSIADPYLFFSCPRRTK